ncbi:hydroxyacylglutathione hydrolase [Magnetovirga frankeli]|uniref:hydroxyacylglutathione hydrolase n=1 Tax=Magnetovirga frankeli TaxID=947516 RepID=UPI0012941354|nr:hydroxyacylglutathione hydrolase [gamma proteobacterium SS-5]
MPITAIPAFTDNYIWLIPHAEPADWVSVVDPGDAEPVLARLRTEGLRVAAILVTHQHGDHCGGVGELVQAFPGIPVYGPAHESASGVSHPLSDGDAITLPHSDIRLQVLELPGHTQGHLAYYRPGALFCGDTLFACGCGRVFSGTPGQLHASLQRIAALPPDTLCYCAHEYTQANIGFAQWVEPDSAALAEYARQVAAQRAAGRPSLPTPLRTELACNPFLRTQVPEVILAAEAYADRPLTDSEAVFTTLRAWKDKDYD